MNYTHHPKKQGIHKINKNPGCEKPSKGILLHNTLLILENGLPLGLLDQKTYQHSEEKAPHKHRPITEKQSFRWIESLRTTQSLCQNKTVVTMGDREADIYEFFSEAINIGAKVLIRAARNRILVGDLEHETLWSHMKKAIVSAMQTISIPARHNQPERLATLEVRYATITLKPPQRCPSAKIESLTPITL